MRRLSDAICLFAFLVPAIGQAVDQNLPEEAGRRLEMIKASEDFIEFYGRVVDQYGKSIEGATISIDVGQATLTPKPPLELSVISNSEGKFGIDPKKDAIKGSMFSVKAIEKDGYEVDFSRGERDFDCRKNNPHRFMANKNAPVVFHMRKKHLMPVFLFKEMRLEFECRIIDASKPLGFDFIRRHRIRDRNNLIYDGEPVTCDLRVEATFSTNDAAWAVVLSPGNTNGGIIVSEQLLYEAPDSGYQADYTFTPEDRKPVKAKYVYLKSREPAIYTRLEIEHINANKEFFRLSGKAVTNPYGDRNLEQATDLPYEVTKQLTDEAKTSFRQNKRPSKPDLPKLVKEAKEKADKSKQKAP